MICVIKLLTMLSSPVSSQFRATIQQSVRVTYKYELHNQVQACYDIHALQLHNYTVLHMQLNQHLLLLLSLYVISI